MKKYLGILIMVLILCNSIIFSFASSEIDEINRKKEMIIQIKNSTPDEEKTNKLFVKAMNDGDCVNILKDALVDYEYSIVKQYRSGIYLLELNSVTDVNEAVDILNLRTDIKFAEPNYYLDISLRGPTSTTISFKIDVEYEPGILKHAGIIIGDENGDLNLFDEITRAEFLVILCRIIGCESDVYVSDLKEKSYFSDVSSDHWGISYINVAYEKGAIRGFPDGSFKPDEPVTNEQAIKMLIAAWGYADEAEANGGYPNGYMKVAKEYGMLDSVSFNHKSPSKRWLSSVFVYNILSVTPKAEGVNPPMTTEIIKHDTIRDENYESYNAKPVEVLKFVTQESALYERTSIKQTVPEEYYPIEHLSCGIKNISDVEYLFLLKDEENTEVWHQQIIKPNEVLDLTTFNMGDYFIELHSKDGVIDDTYSEKIYINKDEIVFTNLMNRTTIRNDF